MTFSGFGPQVFEFYEGLAADNSKVYWTRHADVYAPTSRSRCASWPRPSSRSSANPRSSGRTATSASARTAGPITSTPGWACARNARTVPRPACCSSRSPRTACSSRRATTSRAREQLQRFRTLQDDPDAAADLDATLAGLAADGVPLNDGQPLKTAPRGWSKDHPRIDLIRRTRLTASIQYPPAAHVHDRRCLDLVVDGWRRLDRWNRWLDDNVGA